MRAKVRLEAIFARGLRIWINGREPLVRDWQYGDSDKGVVVSTKDAAPLPFDAFSLQGFDFDMRMEEFECSGTKQPTSIILHTDKGEIALRITRVLYGNPDGDCGESTVELVNGTKVELDETMLYVHAES